MLRRTLLLALTVAGSCVVSGAGARSAALLGDKVFQFTGKEQTFVVPDGVTSVEVQAVGGSGGIARGVPGSGAAQVTNARIGVHSGEILYIEVGGRGQDSDARTCPGVSDCKYAAGGFNGGGSSVAEGGAESGGGGGGASDVQTKPGRDGREAYFSRLVVAGGGGGSGGNGTVADTFGGHGGAPGTEGGAGFGAHAQNGEIGGEGGGGGESTHAGPGGAPGAAGLGNASVYLPGDIGAEGTVGEGGAGVAMLRPCRGCPVKVASGSGGGGGGGYFGGGGGESGGIYNCASKIYRCDPSSSPDVGGGGGGGGGSSYTTNGIVVSMPAHVTSRFDGNGRVQLSWSA